MRLKKHVLHATGIVAAMLLLLAQPLKAGELYFIDAHSQVDEKVDLNDVLALMQQAGVRHTILSARGKRKELSGAEREAAILGRLSVLVGDWRRSYADVQVLARTERDGRELPIQANVVGRHVQLDPDQHIKLSGPDPLKLEIRQSG